MVVSLGRVVRKYMYLNSFNEYKDMRKLFQRFVVSSHPERALLYFLFSSSDWDLTLVSEPGYNGNQQRED